MNQGDLIAFDPSTGLWHRMELMPDSATFKWQRPCWRLAATSTNNNQAKETTT